MLKLKDDPSIPEDVRKVLKKYERGQNILSILELPVWGDILAILKDHIEAGEKRALAYRDSDPNAAFRLLAESQGAKDGLANLESKVRLLTALVTNPPENIQRYITY